MDLQEESEVDGEADGTGTILQRLVRRAIRDWTRQLVDVSGRNTLLCFRPLKAGTLDLARASEEARHALLFGEKIRISDAFGERDRRRHPHDAAQSRRALTRTTRSAACAHSRWRGGW